MTYLLLFSYNGFIYLTLWCFIHIVDNSHDHRLNSESQKSITSNSGGTNLIENSTSSTNTVDNETSLVSAAASYLQSLLSSFLEFVLCCSFQLKYWSVLQAQMSIFLLQLRNQPFSAEILIFQLKIRSAVFIREIWSFSSSWNRSVLSSLVIDLSFPVIDVHFAAIPQDAFLLQMAVSCLPTS